MSKALKQVQERKLYNQQVSQKIEEMDRAEEKEKESRRRLTEMQVSFLKDQTTVEHLAKRLVKEADFMEGDLMYGTRKDETAKPRPTAVERSNVKSIFYKQR